MHSQQKVNIDQYMVGEIFYHLAAYIEQSYVNAEQFQQIKAALPTLI